MEIVWGMDGFEMEDLDVVFTELYKNEIDAKTFIVKPKEMQRKVVLAIIRKHCGMPNMGNSVGREVCRGERDGTLSADDTV